MGIFSKVSRFIEETKLTFSADELGYQQQLTPDNALAKLTEYNEKPGMIAYARRRDVPKLEREWLLNSFQFAAGKVAPNDVVRMAFFLNSSDVFNSVAPDFYGGGTWHNVVQRLIDRCPPAQRPNLLHALEDRGHLQGVMRENGSAAGCASTVFYRQIAEAISVQDAKIIFSRSPSFQIAKQNRAFALDTIQNYPQFKDLF